MSATASPTVPVVPAVVRARVHHRRLHPFTYAFAHRTTMWLVDAAAPNAGFPRWLRLLVSVRSRDHFAEDDPRPLLDKVRHFVVAQRLGWSTHRVLVLTGVRSLGHAFDPLTTYFCLDEEGNLEGVLAEVHNTYGERHCYPLAVTGEQPARSGTDKSFYVSPFFAVDGGYDITTTLDEDRVAVAITLNAPDGRQLFHGSVQGRPRPVSGRRTLRLVAADPLPSRRVAALIRWHGIRLWLRRLPVAPRPPHQAPKGM